MVDSCLFAPTQGAADFFRDQAAQMFGAMEEPSSFFAGRYTFAVGKSFWNCATASSKFGVSSAIITTCESSLVYLCLM